MQCWLKKFTLIFCTGFLIHTTVFAQDFMQSTGLNISVLFGNLVDGNSSTSIAMKQTLFTYFPRFNFLEGENSSLSIGAPVGAGVSLATNDFEDDVGISFAYDLPLVLDYNIGCNAVPNSESNFGGYFGVGFGYYSVKLTGSEYSDFTGTSYGPLVRGGIRFPISRQGYSTNSITIGAYYKKGLEKSRLNTIGLDIFYDF